MKNSGLPLSSFSQSVQAQIVAQLHRSPKPPGGIDVRGNVIAAPPKPRLRQSSKGPNKTELAAAAWLRAEYQGQLVIEQGVTLVLANGLRYTPDLFLPDPGASRPHFYEVKGFMRDDAAAKLKMAARVHPWAVFYLLTKRPKHRGGGWALEEVLR